MGLANHSSHWSGGVAVWVVRTGFTSVTLNNGVVVAGWDLDVSGATSYHDVEALYREKWPAAKGRRMSGRAAQIWDFCHNIDTGDLVVMPRDWEQTVSVGRVTGPFEYRPDLPSGARMTRPVDWLAESIPQSAFDRDVVAILKSDMSVRRVERPDADQRVLAVLGAGQDQPSVPAPSAGPASGHETSGGGISRPSATPYLNAPAADGEIDLEAYALSQIRAALWERFPGTDLIRLLDAILKAQGYQTELLPRGDGYATLLARQEIAGEDASPLCVRVVMGHPAQTYEEGRRVGASALRPFQTAMQQLGARQGLLVAWRGFRQNAVVQARYLPAIRLRDADDVLQALLDHYDLLPAPMQAEIPLRRIWILAQGDPLWER